MIKKLRHVTLVVKKNLFVILCSLTLKKYAFQIEFLYFLCTLFKVTYVSYIIVLKDLIFLFVFKFVIRKDTFYYNNFKISQLSCTLWIFNNL